LQKRNRGDIYLLALYAERPSDWLKESYLMKVLGISHNSLKLSQIKTLYWSLQYGIMDITQKSLLCLAAKGSDAPFCPPFLP